MWFTQIEPVAAIVWLIKPPKNMITNVHIAYINTRSRIVVEVNTLYWRFGLSGLISTA